MHASAERQLIDFVRARHDNDPAVVIDADTDLFASGYLDSIGFVGLSVLVEDLSGKPIDFTRVRPEELSTIRKILALCF
jgi:acyl carrier protein